MTTDKHDKQHEAHAATHPSAEPAAASAAPAKDYAHEFEGEIRKAHATLIEIDNMHVDLTDPSSGPKQKEAADKRAKCGSDLLDYVDKNHTQLKAAYAEMAKEKAAEEKDAAAAAAKK